MHWLRAEVERREDSGERLLAVFDALKAWFGSADFRGCAFINTSGETGDPQAPVRLLAKAHKHKLFSTCSNCVKPMARPSRNGRPRNC